MREFFIGEITFGNGQIGNAQEHSEGTAKRLRYSGFEGLIVSVHRSRESIICSVHILDETIGIFQIVTTDGFADSNLGYLRPFS